MAAPEIDSAEGIEIGNVLIHAGDVDGRDVSVDGTKLDGVETGATKYPDTGEQAFLDADHTKLNGIATSATKYPDTGEQAFLDADHTKLDGIDAGASVLPTGMIMMWYGSTGSIPSGWVICDGTHPTPDLRNKFVVGAGSTYAVDATGGATSHSHGSQIVDASGGATAAANTTRSNLPPYHALCYIMKT